ncbi:delta-like protein D [Mya arenaria]|uniref:delta-like protein D n=1 Tax=Mya arenaria TaxID=6604 RepID=UPI0022E8C7F3|nr:delta-like protein D [Mya arenaria]
MGCLESTCSPTDGDCDCKEFYTGDKCEVCEDGLYGEMNCTQKCSTGCESLTCNPNGTCICKPGFTGDTCNTCVDGRYGANCSLNCSRGCERNNCSSQDGTCNCRRNYSGEQCENCNAGRYGEDCSKPCSLGCLDNTCSSTDGKCDCKHFYTGAKCDDCVDGRYGDGCLNESDLNEPTERDKPNDGTAVGGAIGALLVAAAVAIFAVIILKRRNKLCCKKPRDEEVSEESPEPVVYATVQNRRHTPDPALQRESSHYGHQAQQAHTSFTEHHAETGNNLYEEIAKATDNSNIVQENVKQEEGHRVNIRTEHVEMVMLEETTEDDSLEIDEDDQIARAIAVKFEEKGGIYCNNADTINKQKVAVNSFTKYVIEKTDIDIEEEFEKFPYGLTKPYAVSQMHEHIQRNRYKGIYPYDDTRVKLHDFETDYINASFIDGYNKRHAYIAALGKI